MADYDRLNAILAKPKLSPKDKKILGYTLRMYDGPMRAAGLPGEFSPDSLLGRISSRLGHNL